MDSLSRRIGLRGPAQARRWWLLAGTAALFAGGAIVSCSSNGSGNDAGSDGTIPSDGSSNDVNQNNDGSKNDSSTNNDGSTPACNTTALTGSCDIVQQNCPNGQGCIPAQLADGGWTAQCAASNGNIQEGYACQQTSLCVAGLECIDGRCAKHCCLGDDNECGMSHPEGYTGRCETTVTLDGTHPAYAICTYSSQCQPFDIQPCQNSEICIVEDTSGTSICEGLAANDGGLSAGAKCVYANDCKDGLTCVGALDGGAATCTWECYVPPGPFDAGIVNLGAGKGGCPSGKTCQQIQLLGPDGGAENPAWLGLCE